MNCDTLLLPTKGENGKNVMDYLGFSFDGETVSIRDKTVSKYHYRMIRKARVVGVRLKGSSKKKPDFHGLYRKYSHFGAKSGKYNRGNFITYVNRCIDVFGMNEKVHFVRRRHMHKINKIVKNHNERIFSMKFPEILLRLVKLKTVDKDAKHHAFVTLANEETYESSEFRLSNSQSSEGLEEQKRYWVVLEVENNKYMSVTLRPEGTKK